MAAPPQLSKAALALRESIFARLQGKLDRHGADGIPLHLGDTWLDPPAFALAASRARVRYGAPAGAPALLDALVTKLKPRFPWVERRNLQLTTGATQGLSAVMRALVDPGDEVIVPTPHWPLIRGIVTNAGGIPVEVPLTQQLYQSEGVDAAAILEPHLSDKTRVLYLITPNNPDGKVLSAEHLGQLAALAKRRNLWLVLDEVYEDLIYEGSHQSIAALQEMADRTLTVFSFSKTFALAGYRLGYVVGAAEPMHAVRKISNHTVYNVPETLQDVALALLTDPSGAEWLRTTRLHYLDVRDRVDHALHLPHFKPQGATYFFLDLRDRMEGGSLWPLVERLLDVGVSVAPGEQFGRDFAGYARICFTAAPVERVLEGVARIERVVGL